MPSLAKPREIRDQRASSRTPSNVSPKEPCMSKTDRWITSGATAATLTALGWALVAMPAHANEELAKKSGCLACHAMDKRIVGPSYKEVGAKHRGDETAECQLTDT